MKKILSAVLILSTLLSLFALPVSAEETITDLTNVHTLLTKNLYAAYYQQSEYYEEYQEVMSEIGELLESDDITQAEITKYYNRIKNVYSKMIRDCHDYSSMEMLLEAYDALDSSIFTKESQKLLLSARDKTYKELNAPNIYPKIKEDSDEEYAARYDQRIREFSVNFQNAFNQLEFLPRPEEMTPEYLAGFIKLIRFCAREELLRGTKYWTELNELLDRAEKDIAEYKPNTDNKKKEDEEEKSLLDTHYDALSEAYFNACLASYDFSAAKEALTQYQILTAKSFTKDSWERYSLQAKNLEKRLSQTHFFFIPYKANQKTCESYRDAYLSALPGKLLAEQDALIPQENWDELKLLCSRYANKTTMDGLDIELNRLKNELEIGNQVLSNPDATLDEVTKAIESIETAYNDLITSEGHLREDQQKVVKQDAKSARFNAIFYIASLLLAAIAAVILSKIYLGKVNWSK
ncbi:MAG: hypothetical protein E7580_03805 [Ruminococcaceae bacterium]|nr:hypothetical protein [Oscillospiraceae bacterium]